MKVEYKVRSKLLLDLVNEVRADRLIPDAYFQRDLVWRDVHKKDFIDTILRGYPFPQIFISRGKVDLEAMSTTSCIVDGQQRTNAIIEFIDNEFDVNGQTFEKLTDAEKEDFLKYEIAVIELNLSNDDPRVQEIFQRINRTQNSLRAIEKLASQYAGSEYMLVAKHLADEIDFPDEVEGEFRVDPNIPDEFYVWAKATDVSVFKDLLLNRGIFSSHEVSRKVHLSHVLNVMSTILTGFFNRNERSNRLLDDLKNGFPEKDVICNSLSEAAKIISMANFPARSYWLNKANFFSLLVFLTRQIQEGKVISSEELFSKLDGFASALPEDYKLAASEAVNSTQARQLRNQYLVKLFP